MNTLDTRDALRKLLPWYENGTLNDIERERVRALLATDLEANRQRRELHALREALVDEPTLASNMGSNLQRLRAQMGPQSAVTYVPMTTRWLAIAATAVVALGAATFYAGTRVGPYQTLTAAAALDPVPADADIIRVDVVAGVDAPALAQLAGDPQARVIDGPSEHGVATLAVPHAHAQQVIARLSADPRLRFVAPVPR
jgi:hypothetical protein